MRETDPEMMPERSSPDSPSVPFGPLLAFARQWGFASDSLLLKIALTHTSAAATVECSNERLEFLGDALLSSWVARYLYIMLPPNTREDTLSRARVQIVRKETLAAAGRSIGLQNYLVVGQGERKEQRNERESLIADAYEAVVAALYLESGEDAMARFLTATLEDTLRAVITHPLEDDPKTRLQIILQGEGRGLPRYETLSETREGERHHFVVSVHSADGLLLGTGEGSSKRIAQRNAAQSALNQVLVPNAGALTPDA